MLDYVEKLKEMISENYMTGAELSIRKNKSSVDSVVINSEATAYREALVDLLFAKIKTGGKLKYISFKRKYKLSFTKLGFDTDSLSVKSDTEYFRIPLDQFFESDISPELVTLMNLIFADAVSFPAFGCCSRYKECSSQSKCIHPDRLYATACSYRRNMEAGNAFLKG